MPQVRPLKKPPIIEGLIDLRADGFEFSPERLRRIGELVEPTYPVREELRAYQTQLLPPTIGSASLAQTQDLGLRGMRFRTADKRQIAQFRADGFTLNQLAPYEGWEHVFPEAMRLWQLFLDVFQPSSVKTASVRFINHVQLPPNQSKWEDCLRCPAPVPPELTSSVESLFTTVIVRDQRSTSTARITQSLEPAPRGAAPTLLLDIEALQNGDWTPRDPQIQRAFVDLRDLKNRVFFSTLAEDVIRQYE